MTPPPFCTEHNYCASLTRQPAPEISRDTLPFLEAATVAIACVTDSERLDDAARDRLRTFAARLRRHLDIHPDPERPRRLDAIRRELRQPGATRARLTACWGDDSPLLPRLYALACEENPFLTPHGVDHNRFEHNNTK